MLLHSQRSIFSNNKKNLFNWLGWWWEFSPIALRPSSGAANVPKPWLTTINAKKNAHITMATQWFKLVGESRSNGVDS